MDLKDAKITRQPNGFVECRFDMELGIILKIVIPPDRTEMRFLMTHTLGVQTRLTITMEDHWQKSHMHPTYTENYQVLNGFAALAMMDPGLAITLYQGTPDNRTFFTVDTKLPHNVFYPKGCVVSVSKSGEEQLQNSTIPGQWECPALDDLCARFPDAQSVITAGGGVTADGQVVDTDFYSNRELIPGYGTAQDIWDALGIAA